MKDIRETLTNWQGNKVLMTVYPHPDDETMMAGGLLMLAKSLGWKTIVVTLTKGGAGQIHIAAKGRTLKVIREQELKQSLALLGVDQLELGDFDDGKLRSELFDWSAWVAKQIDTYRPGIIVSYDPSGMTGHPDHIVVSREIQQLAGKTLLLWNTVPSELRNYIINPKVQDFVTSPTHVLALKGSWIRKWWAARAHKSQALGKELPVPLGIAMAKYPFEWYHEAKFDTTYTYKFVDFEI